MRLSIRHLAVSLVLLAVLVLATVIFISRVPDGSILLAGTAVQTAGAHLVLPWRHQTLLPLAADRTLEPVMATAPDGIPLTLRVSFHLNTDPKAVTLDAAALDKEGGLEGHLSRLAAGSITRILSERPEADPLLREVAIREAEAVAGDLSANGLSVSNVSVTTLESDELIRLRRDRISRMARTDRRKVILIGLDGADWQVIDRLLQEGRLPSLAGLLRRGVRADLRSEEPMLSPLLWTTVATGKPPDEHGILDFLLVESETGGRVPMSSRFRRVKALWNILTDAGMSSQFIAWWATWPAETVSGTLVTDRVSYSMFAGLVRDAAGDLRGLTFPPGYINEVKDRLVSPENIGYDEVRRFLRVGRDAFEDSRSKLAAPRDGHPPAASPEDAIVALSRVLASTRSYHAVALDLLKRGQADLFAVYYGGIDQLGHRFQHYMPPRIASISQEDFGRYRDTITSFYEYQDGLLGELIRAASPGTVFLVMSDHGFLNGSGRPLDTPPYVSEKPGLWHRRYGMFILAGPGIRRGRIDTVSLYDIAPTVLHLLGLPRAEDMPGRVLVEALTAGHAGKPDGVRAPSGRAAGPIATYEGLGEHSEMPALTVPGGAAEEELLRQLTALGYLAGRPAQSTPAPAENAEVTAVYHLNLASIHAGRHDYDAAVKEVRAALDRAALPDGYRLLSDILEKKGDRGGAMAALRRAIETAGLPGKRRSADPDRLHLVRLLLLAGRAAEARAMAEQGFDDPAFVQTARGFVAEDEGRKDAAVELYRAALEARPTLVAALERLYPLVAPQDIPALEPIVRRALKENDQLAVYYNILGVILQRGGDLRGAVAAYRRAVVIDPDGVQYLANLGAAEMIGGDLDEALAVLERARNKEPGNPAIWLNLGSVHGKAGRYAQSLDAFARAEELGAEGPGLEVGKILGHAMLGDLATARRFLVEARARYPEDPALRDLEHSLP